MLAISPTPIESMKNNNARKIDCKALNLKKCETCFFRKYNKNKIITPPHPAVRYEIAENILSNMLTENLFIICTRRKLHNLLQPDCK